MEIVLRIKSNPKKENKKLQLKRQRNEPIGKEWITFNLSDTLEYIIFPMLLLVLGEKRERREIQSRTFGCSLFPRS